MEQQLERVLDVPEDESSSFSFDEIEAVVEADAPITFERKVHRQSHFMQETRTSRSQGARVRFTDAAGDEG